MPTCHICGEALPEGTRTCAVCGTGVPDFGLPTATVIDPPVTQRRTSALAPSSLPPGGRFCPGCGQVYAADFTDSFCLCGTELLTEIPATPPEPETTVFEEQDLSLMPSNESMDFGFSFDAAETAPAPPAPPPEPPPAPAEPELAIKAPRDRPPPGTPCLVLYGPDKQAMHYFALSRDVTAIGRLDAVAGQFPDVDLDEWLDPAIARKVSRQHALILRSRASGGFVLRPLAGNTGTQVEGEMVLPMHDYPLTPGMRVILGGVARFKFETA